MGSFVFPNNDILITGDDTYTPVTLFTLTKDPLIVSFDSTVAAKPDGNHSFHLTNHQLTSNVFTFETIGVFYFYDQEYTPGNVFQIPQLFSEYVEPPPTISGSFSFALDDCGASFVGEYDVNVNRFLTHKNCSSIDESLKRIDDKTIGVTNKPYFNPVGSCDAKDAAMYLDIDLCSVVGSTLVKNTTHCDAKDAASVLIDKFCSQQEQLTIFNKRKYCSVVSAGTPVDKITHDVKQQLTKMRKYKSCSVIDDMSNYVHHFVKFYYDEVVPGSDYLPGNSFTIETKPEYDDGRIPLVPNAPKAFLFPDASYVPSDSFAPLHNTYDTIGNDHGIVKLAPDVYIWDGAWSIFYNSDSYQVGGYRLRTCANWTRATNTEIKRCSILEEARRPPNGRTPWIDLPRPPIDPDPPSGETIIIPVQDVYTMLNVITVTLDDDLTPIDLGNIKLTLDADSYAWQFSASLLDPDQIDSVKQLPDGTAIILHVTINTYVWHILVEKIVTTKSFEKTSINISGRGISGLLAKPYYQPVSQNFGSLQTVQQIADNITPFGWVNNWSTVTWNVDAGAYSYANKTPIEALKDIADDIGAMLVPSRDAQEFTFKPRYPVLPWNFSLIIPDVIIPENVITQLTEEPVSSFQANAVYLHGDEIGGELAYVRLNGTLGDRLAPTQNNTLMTDVIGLRALGERILAGQYSQPKFKSITTFMDGAIVPLMDLGSLVQINIGVDEIKGIVNGIAISADINKVTQTLTIGESTPNTWAAFSELLPQDPMLVATLSSTDGTTALMTMLDLGIVRVRGTGVVGSKYYIRSGEIVSAAPDLTLSNIVI